MLPLESAIALPLKNIGFRKKSRTWRRTTDETICVLNLQENPFGENLYVNLGVYLRAPGQELNPPPHRCHISVRLEQIADKQKLNEIVSAQSQTTPSKKLIEAILPEGLS